MVPIYAKSSPGSCSHAGLVRHGLDRGGGHVLRAAREAALSLEQLEQHGEAQPRGAGLVAEQRALGGAQCPAAGGVTDRSVSVFAHCDRFDVRVRR